jgi:hypothetical protein
MMGSTPNSLACLGWQVQIFVSAKRFSTALFANCRTRWYDRTDPVVYVSALPCTNAYWQEESSPLPPIAGAA